MAVLLTAFLTTAMPEAPDMHPTLASACADAEDNYGCSVFCGYQAVTTIDGKVNCKKGGLRKNFPFEVTDEDADELCTLIERDHGCSDTCGYRWDAEHQLCKHIVDVTRLGDGPIIGGYGDFRYQFMPDLLQPPAGANFQNCHGLALDKDKNIILTYQPAGKDPHCLIRWNPDGTGGEFASKDTPELCTGVPHGLKITTEGDKQFLYHANNQQKLAKTTLDGEIVWIQEGPFGQNMTCGPDTCPQNSCRCPGGQAPYIPTWFATPPNSRYMYLCDGYGSDRVFAFDSKTGTYMNKSWGGRSPGGLHPGAAGPTQPHGKFMENHGCTYDPRNTTEPNTIVVSDRRNQRFEFFHYDPESVETFEWYKTVDMSPSMGPDTLPCNMRMYPEQDGRAIMPDLNGPVAVLDNKHNVISVVNVSVLLAALQHKHPHDAIFLPNGDMVVATWAPGRISYWKRLPSAPPAPTDAKVCADGEPNAGVCQCNGEVYYGKKYVLGKPGNGTTTTISQLMQFPFEKKQVHGSIKCDLESMGGDPLEGYYKYCYCVPTAPSNATFHCINDQCVEATDGLHYDECSRMCGP